MNADLLDGNHASAFVTVDGTTALTSNWDAGAYEIRALTFESDVTTGTAPFTVASTTKVTNLNADLLDDQSGSYYLDIANFNITSEAQGDILYHNGSSWARLAAGTDGYFLKTQGAAADPIWALPDTSEATIIADDTEVAGAGGVSIRRLVYFDSSTGKYLQANGTSEATAHVVGAATAAAIADAALNVAYAGRQELELPATHAAITQGDYLYLAQEAGGYAVGKSDIAFTNNYVILPVAIALESVSLNTGGAIKSVIGAVGLYKFVN
jgi:hypothetical protein